MKLTYRPIIRIQNDLLQDIIIKLSKIKDKGSKRKDYNLQRNALESISGGLSRSLTGEESMEPYILNSERKKKMPTKHTLFSKVILKK